MASICEGTRVVKKLSASQAGALKLARRFGPALVCVRYRQDERGLRRYTTVELVVDDAPVVSERTDAMIVGVKIEITETALRHLVKQHGAQWDREARVWRMSNKWARILGLDRRISSK